VLKLVLPDTNGPERRSETGQFKNLEYRLDIFSGLFSQGSQDTNENEVRINQRGFQKDEHNETQSGEAPVKPAFDLPAFDPFLLRFHVGCQST